MTIQDALQRQLEENEAQGKPNGKANRYQVDSNRPLPDEGGLEICVQVQNNLAGQVSRYLDNHPTASADSLINAALAKFFREQQS
jgi:hypothetical protein